MKLKCMGSKYYQHLQRFALKPKPRKFLKALLRNAFKNFLVVRLIGNCCISNVTDAVIGEIGNKKQTQ